MGDDRAGRCPNTGDMTVKLYMHPVSMTSRPVRLLIAENNLDVEEQVVDLFTGEHVQDAYAAVNAISRAIPTSRAG